MEWKWPRPRNRISRYIAANTPADFLPRSDRDDSVVWVSNGQYSTRSTLEAEVVCCGVGCRAHGKFCLLFWWVYKILNSPQKKKKTNSTKVLRRYIILSVTQNKERKSISLPNKCPKMKREKWSMEEST